MSMAMARQPQLDRARDQGLVSWAITSRALLALKTMQPLQMARTQFMTLGFLLSKAARSCRRPCWPPLDNRMTASIESSSI